MKYLTSYPLSKLYITPKYKFNIIDFKILKLISIYFLFIYSNFYKLNQNSIEKISKLFILDKEIK
jgi:hypothetical protein